MRAARCDEHAQKRSKRATPNDPFYWSTAWRKLRKRKLQADPLCELCLAKDRVTPATEVHHKQARRVRPELELVFDNLQSTCKPCHSAETAREIRGHTKS